MASEAVPLREAGVRAKNVLAQIVHARTGRAKIVREKTGPRPRAAASKTTLNTMRN